jgi:CPA2 family monovalent cation:H+ antiporter-2
MQGIHLIHDLAIILVVAGVAGWICKRIGSPVIVGFLAAGMLVGPRSAMWPLVPDSTRLATLAQIGLVFVMFALGLRLSLRRFRRLGASLSVATFLSAVGVYYLTRLLGATLGWSSAESLFVAAIVMVSSSTIVRRMLHETVATHERFGHLALGKAAIENVLAVILLTLLGSYVQFGGWRGPDAPLLGETLGMLAAFVALAVFGGLLLVPWLLRRMRIAADDGLQTLGIAALLFGLAFVAQRAGYSLALGAFLLGTIVAETAHRNQVERSFEGIRDVFTAIFFVTVGMQVDARILVQEAGLIAGVAVFTLVVRAFASAAALTIAGNSPRDAIRAGMAVTPIGEFSFIIAQLGVTAAVVPARVLPLAVGVSLLTSLVAPWLTRHSEAIANAVVARQPRWSEVWVRYYHARLERLHARRRRNRFWQLSRKRFLQIGIEIVVVSAVLVFSGDMFGAVEKRLGRDWLFPHGPEVIFWLALCLVLLAPVVAIWRNISALALIFAQFATPGSRRGSIMTTILERGLKVAAGLGLFVWLVMMLPTEGTARWLLLGSAVVAVISLVLLRQRLIYWHSHLEVELQTVISTAEHHGGAAAEPWFRPHAEWNLHILDCVLPDLADAQGSTIAGLELRTRSGCSVVGIERQGYMIPLPAADAVLYPRDRVLLMGTKEQVEEGRKILTAVSDVATGESVIEEVQMQALSVPAWSQALGRTLGELALAQTFAVQVVGINRSGQRILNPAAEETLQAGDELLVLGMQTQLVEFSAWLRERPDEDAGEDAEGSALP